MIRTVQAPTYNQRKFLTDKEVNLMLKNCKNTREEFLITFLADTGARITEALMCKIEYMNVFAKEVFIPTLKKRGEGIIKLRLIKMSERLKEIFIRYWQTLEQKKKTDWLFPSTVIKEDALTRQAVDLKLKRIARHAGIKIPVSAHKFRHSFGTRLAGKKTPPHVIKELMGHEKVQTTFIYTHSTDEWKQLAISSISTDNWLTKVKRKLLGEKPVGMIPTTDMDLSVLIGRNEEIDFLTDMSKKQQNVMITGKGGTGKTKLLDTFIPNHNNVLRLQDLKGGNKKVLGNILLHLFKGEKKAVLEMLYGEDIEEERLGKRLDKEKETELMKLVQKVTKPKEYTIIIDDVSQLTKTTAILIEKMKQHFHMICAARSVKVDYEHTFSNFRFLELKPFNRAETISYIEHLTKSYKIHIRDFEVLTSHIFNETGGNPQYIMEMVKTYEAEGDFSAESIMNIKHTAGRKVIDMTFFFLLCFCSLMVLRYVGSEVGEDSGAFRFIGGAVMVIALFARQFVNLGKRKVLSGY